MPKQVFFIRQCFALVIFFWKELSKTLTDRINLASSLVCNENTCKTLFRSMAAKWLIGSGGTNTAAEMKCKKLSHLLIYSECFFKNCHKMFSQLWLWHIWSQTHMVQGRRKVWKSGGARNTRWGECAPPLVEIGLTDLPKSGGHGPPRPPHLRRAWLLSVPQIQKAIYTSVSSL